MTALARIYIAVMATIATAVLAIVGLRWNAANISYFALFFSLAMVASAMKIRLPGLRINQRQGERSELSMGRADLPFTVAPINDTRRILTDERRSCRKMRIVEGDIGRRDSITFSLNVHIPGSCVADVKRMGRIVKGITLFCEFLPPADGFTPDRYRVRNEIQTQHVRGFIIERRIRDRSPAISDFRNHRERT